MRIIIVMRLMRIMRIMRIMRTIIIFIMMKIKVMMVMMVVIYSACVIALSRLRLRHRKTDEKSAICAKI